MADCHHRGSRGHAGPASPLGSRPRAHGARRGGLGARAAADAVRAGDERPFAGVPLAIKDLFAPVAGLRMSQGSDLLGEYAPDYDNALVRRFREAGFVLVGKTATPEFGIPPVTEPRRFGPTHNPWDPSRTPGGSSGGAAAAVAARALPLAPGSG